MNATQSGQTFDARTSNPSSKPTDESAFEAVQAAIPDVAKQVIEQAKRLPELVDNELKENPYRLLGIVGGVGLGVGMLIGSRVMRTIIVSVGGYAVTEALRGYVTEAIHKTAQDDTSH